MSCGHASRAGWISMMSMTGFARRFGTAVLPKCSRRTLPNDSSARRIAADSSAYCCGHDGSGSTMTIASSVAVTAEPAPSVAPERDEGSVFVFAIVGECHDRLAVLPRRLVVALGD